MRQKRLQDAFANTNLAQDTISKDFTSRKGAADEWQGIQSCIDYLRQSVMCYGDTTLEKPAVDTNGSLVTEFRAWRGIHQCRSWRSVFDFAMLNSYRPG